MATDRWTSARPVLQPPCGSTFENSNPYRAQSAPRDPKTCFSRVGPFRPPLGPCPGAGRPGPDFPARAGEIRPGRPRRRGRGGGARLFKQKVLDLWVPDPWYPGPVHPGGKRKRGALKSKRIPSSQSPGPSQGINKKVRNKSKRSPGGAGAYS